MTTTKIRSVHAREIIDCRGYPTVEVDVTLENGAMGRAGVPAGLSTGTHKAREVRDGVERYSRGCLLPEGMCATSRLPQFFV